MTDRIVSSSRHGVQIQPGLGGCFGGPSHRECDDPPPRGPGSRDPAETPEQ